MPSFDRNQYLAKAAETGTLDAADVLDLRRSFYGDGAIGADEAAALFELNDAVGHPSEEWTTFFLEAMTDWLVHQAEPEGYVDEANATWLIDHITADGRVKSSTELELLVKVMEAARSVPARLSSFALGEVRHAVVDGTGVTRHGALEPGRIGMGEVALVRRVLYAAGGDTGIAVSREEAEAMFAIDDAIGEADNVPEWASLFAKAVSNYLLAAVLYRAPTREQAVRRDQWLDAPDMDASFLDRLVDGLTHIGNTIEYLTSSLGDDVERAHAADNAADSAEIEAAAELTAAEAEWVFDRIGRNGRVTPAEAALVDYMRLQASRLPPGFESMAARLGKAA